MVTTINPTSIEESDSLVDETPVVDIKPLKLGDKCIYAPECQGTLAMIYGELNCYVCGRSQYQRIVMPEGSSRLKL